MNPMTETRFLELYPEAVGVAERKLHEELPDDCLMKVYYYRYRGTQNAYAFCYQKRMVFNPIFLPIPISRDQMGLFCYEWFLEWEHKTAYKMFRSKKSYYYNCPDHVNSWAFAEKWERRYKDYSGMGECLREYTKKEIVRNTKSYLKDGTQEERQTFKQEMEALLRAL